MPRLKINTASSHAPVDNDGQQGPKPQSRDPVSQRPHRASVRQSGRASWAECRLLAGCRRGDGSLRAGGYARLRVGMDASHLQVPRVHASTRAGVSTNRRMVHAVSAAVSGSTCGGWLVVTGLVAVPVPAICVRGGGGAAGQVAREGEETAAARGSACSAGVRTCGWRAGRAAARKRVAAVGGIGSRPDERRCGSERLGRAVHEQRGRAVRERWGRVERELSGLASGGGDGTCCRRYGCRGLAAAGTFAMLHMATASRHYKGFTGSGGGGRIPHVEGGRGRVEGVWRTAESAWTACEIAGRVWLVGRRARDPGLAWSVNIKSCFWRHDFEFGALIPENCTQTAGSTSASLLPVESLFAWVEAHRRLWHVELYALAIPAKCTHDLVNESNHSTTLKTIL
ncbi:hypothetical protein DENSPDRAFT_848978 [Dentipellis sp. KUC8613]|nr:hypothetical protein DENSPDRAFT_848978 [Dentipellis sp. KUC8613]